MARQIAERDLAPLLEAARRWIDTCLIEDGSLFAPNRALWTTANAEVLQRDVVDRPDAGGDDFMTKLQRQLANAGASAQQFAADLLWALLLFPSKIGVKVKREHIERIWGWSGEPLPTTGPWLDADVLRGVGSAGTAYNNLRWKELAYLVALLRALKALPVDQRRVLFADYDRFIDWIDSVPRDGDRQFRHMLRWFTFPDQVERMSSNNDRRHVLEGYGVASRRELRNWSDRQLDDALLQLREAQEAAHPGQLLDFYDPPLVSRWQPEDDDSTTAATAPAVREPDLPALLANPSTDPAPPPVNLILYGPPGTGKTHWLRQTMLEYTDTPSQVDPDTWLHETLSGYGWRAVIAAALADLNRPARVTERVRTGGCRPRPNNAPAHARRAGHPVGLPAGAHPADEHHGQYRRSPRALHLRQVRGRRLAPADRKGRPSPAEADMYQLHAYAGAFQCPELALIYPWDASARVVDANYRLRGWEGSPTTVHVLCTDVADDAMPLGIGAGPAGLTQLFQR